MHGQVNGETPATHWPDSDSVSYIQPGILVSNAAPRFSCFSRPAILLSSKQCPDFVSTRFAFCSSTSYWIRLTALILAAGLA